MRLENRVQAGKLLADKLLEYKDSDPLVLALPRGGVPVANEVALALDAELDIIAVRKIGASISPELAIGAICENDRPLFNDNIMKQLRLTPESARQTIRSERNKILNQIEKFRLNRKLPVVKDRMIILVDDGLATGATMRAAIRHLKRKKAKEILVAVPTAAKSTAEELRPQVSSLVALIEEERFSSVGEWYRDFSEVTDSEVVTLLAEHNQYKKLPIENLRQLLSENIVPLNVADDFDALIRSVKDKRVVMLGESTHGTHEFYTLRRIISQRLIEEHGFKFIAVEGDWPDAFRLHQYINNDVGESAQEVLLQNSRWPTWMWANKEIVDLAEWMKDHKAGFFGLDVYSLFDSIEEVLKYVQKFEPDLVDKISQLYSCFDPFNSNEVAYAKSLVRYPEGCEKEVVGALKHLLEERVTRTSDSESLFSAQQNARIIAGAEAYYRAMIQAGEDSWNIRDRHMLQTLTELLEYHGEGAKAIVWAHNTHIGDYRATDMPENGNINLGGIARENYGEDNVALVGFGTHRGEVLAGEFWGAPEQVMTLPAARTNSFEEIFHRFARSERVFRFHVDLKGPLFLPLSKRLDQRAVGVVYSSQHEHKSNYVPTELSNRYDHFVYLDRTSALRSLHTKAQPERLPETWPSGQ